MNVNMRDKSKSVSRGRTINKPIIMRTKHTIVMNEIVNGGHIHSINTAKRMELREEQIGILLQTSVPYCLKQNKIK